MNSFGHTVIALDRINWFSGQERSCEAQIVNLWYDNLKCWSSGPGEQALPCAPWMSHQSPTDLTFGHQGTSPHMREQQQTDWRREFENRCVCLVSVCVCGHQKCSFWSQFSVRCGHWGLAGAYTCWAAFQAWELCLLFWHQGMFINNCCLFILKRVILYHWATVS